MWSFGCIIVELFLGLPLFPGSSEYDQVARLVDLLGLPPTHMIEHGRQSRRYFAKVASQDEGPAYRLKAVEEFSLVSGSGFVS